MSRTNNNPNSPSSNAVGGTFNTSTSQAGSSSSASGEPKAVTYGVFTLTQHGLDDDSRRIVLVRDDGILLLEGSMPDDHNQALYTKSTLPSATTPPELSDFFRRAELMRHIPLAKIVSLDIRSQGCTIRLGIMAEHDLVLSDPEAGYMSQFLMALDHAVRKAAVFVKGNKSLQHVFDAGDMNLETPADYVSIAEKMDRRANIKGFSLGSHGTAAKRPFTLYDWNATMLPMPPVIDVSAASSPEVAKSLSEHVIIILGHVYLHRPAELPAPPDPADRVRLRVFALSRHQLFLLMPERGEIKYKGSLFGLKKIELVPPTKKQNGGGGSGGSNGGTPTSQQGSNAAGSQFPSSPSQSVDTSNLAGVMTSAGDSVAAVLEQEKMILHMEDPQVPQFILSFKRSKSAAPTADVTNSIKTVAASICSLFERQGYHLPMIDGGKILGNNNNNNNNINKNNTPTTITTTTTPANNNNNNNSNKTNAPSSPAPSSTSNPTPFQNLDHRGISNKDPQQQQQKDLLAAPPARKTTDIPNSQSSNDNSVATTPAATNNSNNNNNVNNSTNPNQLSPRQNLDHRGIGTGGAAPTTPRNTSNSSPNLNNNTNASFANNNNNNNDDADDSDYALNLSPGVTPRAGGSNFNSPRNGGDDAPSALGSPSFAYDDANQSFIGADALPEGASPTTVSRYQSFDELGTAQTIPDYKKIHPSLAEFGNKAVLLVRKCMRLTSKLRWETRFCIITRQQIILCAPDKTVRRSIAISSVKLCIVTNHWEAAALTLLVEGAHDCVLRSHKDAPREHQMKHIAGLLANELSAPPGGGGLKVEFSHPITKLPLKQVVSQGRNLHKGANYVSPAVEVQRIKSGLAPSPAAAEAERLKKEAALEQQRQHEAAAKRGLAETFVKDYPANEKERFASRLRIFYGTYYKEGLATIDKSLPTVLREYALTEKEIIEKMCSKYKVDPANEQEGARAKNVYPDHHFIKATTTATDNNNNNNNNNNDLVPESSLSRMNQQNNADQQVQPLVVSAAPFVKDLPPSEKERLRKRVKNFYENHYPAGLKTFDQSIENVLGGAAYTEEYLFSRMYSKYTVDARVEQQQAADAGVLAPSYEATVSGTLTKAASSPKKTDSPLRRSDSLNAAPRAIGIKDMSQSDKDRIRRRVFLFYQNHHQPGLNNFDQNIDTVLNTATYSEEYLFIRMYEKYGVEMRTENMQATAAGVMGSKLRSRPVTPTRKGTDSPNASSPPTQQQQQDASPLSKSSRGESYLQQAGNNNNNNNTRELSVSGEVNQWLSPDRKKNANDDGAKNKPFSAKSTNIIYSQVFENTDLSTSASPKTISCRGVIFDAKKQNYESFPSSQSQQRSVTFNLRNLTPLLDVKTAWSQELSSSINNNTDAAATQQQQQNTSLLADEVGDQLRVTMFFAGLGIVVDVPLAYFCRTFLPHVEQGSMQQIGSGEWEAVSEYSAWKVKTRASFA